ncbi:MAG: D-alanyl-D-alanine carboxypeptidase, partial [Microbacterium sp.]
MTPDDPSALLRRRAARAQRRASESRSRGQQDALDRTPESREPGVAAVITAPPADAEPVAPEPEELAEFLWAEPADSTPSAADDVSDAEPAPTADPNRGPAAASSDPQSTPTTVATRSEPAPITPSVDLEPAPTADPAVTSADSGSDRAAAPTGPEPDPTEQAPAVEPPSAAWADATRQPTALAWVDDDAVATGSITTVLDEQSASPAPADLLSDARLRPGWLRPRVLVPSCLIAGLAAAYCATTLLWPLDNVAPQVKTTAVHIDPAPAAAIAWPGVGTAAVAVQGIGTVSSSTDESPIASITKVVSSSLVLEERPLQPGEQGPSFEFTYQDSLDYWEYRVSDQSALDVPVDGTLTEYQLLQGTLLGSANNYIDRLSKEIWGSDAAFSDAAAKWLHDQGIDDISIATPSGFDERNLATPAALIRLGEVAMRNPVFAEIVGTKSVTLPGAGLVENTNTLLAEDPGIVGIKTGTMTDDFWNLLTAKDVTANGQSVRLYAAVLGQPDDAARVEATRSLYAQVQKALDEQSPAVPAGTRVGTVTTEWGAQSDIVTDDDARVVLWDGATATASVALGLIAKTVGERQDAGAKAGTLTA